MARIQELLEGRDDRIDYEDLKVGFPWIVERDKYCILSPDSDGLLCGLLMSHFLKWQVKGFYDGKVMLLEKGLCASECIFLDMEIFRRNIRSMGHHMVLYNKNDVPENWDNFDECIQPNNLRGYDCLHTFRLKYPLATIHLLMGIIGSEIDIQVPESAICSLLFTDGTYQVLFTYPENVLNWLRYLRADEKESPLNKVFENERYSVFKLMNAMDEFFRERDDISIPRERGDRLRISNPDGTAYNIEPRGRTYGFGEDALGRIKGFIEILSRQTSWIYNDSNWAWTNLELYTFTKRSFVQDDTRVNGPHFRRMVEKNPLSWAITSGNNIEYTIEEPDKIERGQANSGG